MSQFARHQINAVVCVVVAAHGVYWFATQGSAGWMLDQRMGLAAAEVIIGVVGMVWFWRRARQTAGSDERATRKSRHGSRR